MSAANELIGEMVDTINQGGDHKLLVDESLRYTLKSIELCPKIGDKMLLGYEGMPKTSKKLVSLGVFCINDEYVSLHPDIYEALEKKKAKRDRLLERLKRLSADREESISEQDLAGLL